MASSEPPLKTTPSCPSIQPSTLPSESLDLLVVGEDDVNGVPGGQGPPAAGAGHGEDPHGVLGEDGAEVAGPGSAGQRGEQLLAEAAAHHAVEQEVGGGVEVVQHVGQVAGHVDGDAVVVAVEVGVVVLGAQDAVGDEARQAEHHEGDGHRAQEDDGPADHAARVGAADGAALFLGEEAAGTAQVVGDERVVDDNEDDGDAGGEEGRDPHDGGGVERLAVEAARQRHVARLQRQRDRRHLVDPAHGHGGQVRHQHHAHAGEHGGAGAREALLGGRGAQHQVALDGEHHHDPGAAVEGPVLEDAHGGAPPGVGVPEWLQRQEGEAQVQQDHPHQVGRVHHRQAAQVDHGWRRHAALTEADHVESEKVRWEKGKEQKGKVLSTVFLSFWYVPSVVGEIRVI